MFLKYPSSYWGYNRKAPPQQPNNPTDKERYELVEYVLESTGRIEDFNNIIKLLSPPINNNSPQLLGKLKGAKIGIIGGGLAGLSAAFELRKFGFDITIFEALENHVGGRVYTHYFDEKKGLYGELGAMRVPASHETVWHYINLFKLSTKPFIQRNKNAFIYVQDERIRNDLEGKNIKDKLYPLFHLEEWERNMPWPKLNSYALERHLLNLPAAIRTEILKIKPKYNPLYLNLERFSIRKSMEVLGLSEGAINLIASIDPITGSFLYNSYNEILQDIYPVNFAYLYRIEGGMSKLPLAFYESLLSENPKEYDDIPNNLLGKVKWKGGNWVTGIYKYEKGGKVVLKYKSKSLKEDEKESFDYVICTIPFSTLRNIEINPLFTERKMQAIREVNYSNSQKTLFLCDKRFWEEGDIDEKINGGISYTDKVITTIVYPSDHAACDKSQENNFSTEEPGVLLASYNFTLDATRLGNTNSENRFQIVKEQVEEVHGLEKGALDSIVKEYVTREWDNEPWALGAFSMFYPGQKRIFLYDMEKPEYENRVFFAGEHISCNHAWMQGALQSGIIAANMLIKVKSREVIH